MEFIKKIPFADRFFREHLGGRQGGNNQQRVRSSNHPSVFITAVSHRWNYSYWWSSWKLIEVRRNSK